MTDLGSRLLTGERILWSGRPGQGIRFTGQDVVLIPFSLVWGVPVWLAIEHPQAKAATFPEVWLILFGLMGLYIILGRFLLDAWVRRGMLYAVTNQRILIFRPGPFSKFTALSLDRLPETDLSEGGSGRGTIRFGGPARLWGRNNFSSWTPALDPTPQFIAIDNARDVFNQIQVAARSLGDRRERRSEGA